MKLLYVIVVNFPFYYTDRERVDGGVEQDGEPGEGVEPCGGSPEEAEEL